MWSRSLKCACLYSLLSIPTSAYAQCVDNSGYILASGQPIQTVFPLGVGTSLNTLLSTINTVNTAFLTNTISFVSSPAATGADQATGGIWSRTVGGYVDTKATSTFAYSTPSVAAGTGSCSTKVHEEYVGSQFGLDLGRVNLGGGGANIHFGITGGYFVSKASDLKGAGVDAPLIITFPEGKLEADFQVPFVGAYAVLTSGGFFMDSQVRLDLYRGSLTDASNGLASNDLSAQGISAFVNMGYKMPLSSNWFVEPSIGGIYSIVSVDNFSAPGVVGTSPAIDAAFCTKLILLGIPCTPRGPIAQNFGKGVVEFDDIESILGRASLRIGTSLVTGTYVWQPFATASVFREFASAARATTTATDPPNAGAMFVSATDRVGTYGQFGIGSSVAFGDSGWLGYGRVDYKTGERVEGLNVSFGVRHHW
jgi:hypothetical protein